jgi:hypothetical protein
VTCGADAAARSTFLNLNLSNHAGLVVPAAQRARLERVCRYVLRPPVSQERLNVTDAGEVRLPLPQPWRDGTRSPRSGMTVAVLPISVGSDANDSEATADFEGPSDGVGTASSLGRAT